MKPTSRSQLLKCLITLLVTFQSFALEECRIKKPEQIIAEFPSIELAISKLMQQTEITGLSLVILKEGKTLFTKQYGDAHTNPLFQAASISKPVAAFGALKLAETKLLSMTEPLSRFVIKPYLPIQEFTELVTARNVLNHTSGMSNDVTGEDRKLYFKPGSQYSYSGGGFLYLQQAIEDLSHTEFSAYMKPLLLNLRMPNSSFELTYEGVKYIGAPYSLVSTPAELGVFFDQLSHPKPEHAWALKEMTTPTWHVKGPMHLD